MTISIYYHKITKCYRYTCPVISRPCTEEEAERIIGSWILTGYTYIKYEDEFGVTWELAHT